MLKPFLLFAAILAVATCYAFAGGGAVDQVSGAVSARDAAINAALGR